MQFPDRADATAALHRNAERLHLLSQDTVDPVLRELLIGLAEAYLRLAEAPPPIE